MSKSPLQVANEEYIAEFPFLRKWLGEINPKDLKYLKIRVERLDLDVLRSTGYINFDLEYMAYAPSSYGSQQFFCIGKDGFILRKLLPSILERVNFSLFRPSSWFREWTGGETVEQALLCLASQQQLSSLRYVVSVRKPLLETRITIYKLPVAFSLEEFVNKEEERIRQDVKKKLQKSSPKVE
ncbi:MAG: hypothetical protein AAB364_01490 [Patescibacteria group bacterium]